MHYCFLTTGSWEGNASFVRLREFGIEFAARGHRVSCIADNLPFNRENVPGAFQGKAEIHFIDPPRGLGQFRARRAALKKIAPDFVHVLNPFAKAYLALRFSGLRIVGDWDEWPAFRQLPAPRLLAEKFLDRWLRNRSSLVVVASKYLQARFAERFGLDSVYIPYAAYLTPVPPGASPFNEPTAVYMGNLYPSYDHDLLFAAALLLKSRGLNPRLVILGTGPDLEKWRAFVTEHELTNVSVAGYVTGEALWHRLSHAHVLLFPIRPTLLNLCRCPSKTFAYAQTRRPVITCRVGEVPEVLGENATYIEPTAAAFADAIADAMAKPGPDIDYGIERHNWAARADTLLEAVRRIDGAK